jgi:hypothetical protein
MDAARRQAESASSTSVSVESASRGRLGPKRSGGDLGARMWALGAECKAALATAKCDVRAALELDPHVRFPGTVHALRGALQAMQRATSLVLHGLAPSAHEHVAWLLLNGCGDMFATAEPLVALGHARVANEFLTWCALTMEGVVVLSATRHLPWRMRLYAAIAHAYEDEVGHSDEASRQ